MWFSSQRLSYAFASGFISCLSKCTTPVLFVSALPQREIFSLERPLTVSPSPYSAGRDTGTETVENRLTQCWRTSALMMMMMKIKIWRHANPSRITFHLLCVCVRVCVCTMKRPPGMCAVLCVPAHVFPLVRAHNNEPVGCSLASGFIHPGWSSVERGDTSATPAGGSAARVRRGTSSCLSRPSTYWRELQLFPERRSISSHVPLTQVI